MTDEAMDAAARKIQSQWRNRHPPAKVVLEPETRWEDAMEQTKLELATTAAAEGRNSPKERWKRAIYYTRRLQSSNAWLEDRGLPDQDAENKVLEAQHWLELVDGKHRYGSNLKWYHQRWQEEETKENFFQWQGLHLDHLWKYNDLAIRLDSGGGKDLSLDQCPRDQLEKERIRSVETPSEEFKYLTKKRYLSAEERLNYLVDIDETGKIRWAKNGELVDTSAGHWKDIAEEGIVPADDPREDQSTHSQISDKDQDNAAWHYMGQAQESNWSRFLKRFTLKGAMERLLRKTVRRNTWMYVSDKNFNVFVGIKETGKFQHSSFLAGGVVTSAGLISVKKGRIYTLSPLSGHYRTKVDHFHRFLDALEERQVDMSKVRVSKAEAVLWGIEKLAKLKNKEAQLKKAGKETVAGKTAQN